jgi:oligo-1,6-glucosidase
MGPQLKKRWWKEAVIYQVYPRSFKDSNGDGIGDLRGLVDSMDYIASLGIDILWLNPVFRSSGFDNGYDICNFQAIQPEYGTMNDFQQVIGSAHQRGIRVIIDMVLNHTSDRHEWFRQALTSRDNPYYSYYHWWPAENGEPPHRFGFFDAEGRGWHFNAPTNSWYLHYFSPEQPDLNWENQEVRRKLYDILRFWLAKGLDGFRFDAMTFISKDTDFPEITPEMLKENYHNDWGYYYASGPRLHEYLREMRREALAGRDIVAIAEAPGILPEEATLFVAEDRGELDLITHFGGMGIGYLQGGFKKPDPAGYSMLEFKEVYTLWSDIFRREGWGTLYLGNHDQPRMVSRWGDDSGDYRALSSKLLFTFLLTMRSTPFIYNGDELAMANIRFTSIDDYEDIETRRIYEQIKANNGDTDAFLRDQQFAGRDNGRTPFQWTSGPEAGYTIGQPWLKVNPDHDKINREVEESDTASVLNYVRRLIALRRQYPALIYGDYEMLTHDDSRVYAYARTWQGAKFVILLNFSSKESSFGGLFALPAGSDVLSNNCSDIQWSGIGLRLYPWQALVFGCKAG